MDKGKVSDTDSLETDVEKGPDTVAQGQVDQNGLATHHKIELDTGVELVRFRRHWWQLW